MHMKIHTQGIRGSGAIKEGEDPDVMFNAVVEINGVLVEEVTRVRVLYGSGDIATVIVRFIPGTLETVAHTAESWNALWADRGISR